MSKIKIYLELENSKKLSAKQTVDFLEEALKSKGIKVEEKSVEQTPSYQEVIVNGSKNHNGSLAERIENYLNEVTGVVVERRNLDRQQKKTNEDPQRLQIFLLKVSQFMLPLPDLPELEELRLKQELLLENLENPQLKENPGRFEGILRSAFCDYHNLYINIYIQHHCQFCEQVKKFQQESQEYVKKIQAISKLDNIQKLGPTQGKLLQEKLKDWRKQYPICQSSKNQLKDDLTNNPFCPVCQLSWEQIFPDQEWQKFKESVDSAWQNKISQIQAASIQKLLRQSQEIQVKKFIDLLRLAKLEAVIDLLNSKASQSVIKEIKQILN